MKDAYYFSHDSNSRHDPKLVSFCSIYGIKGYAYFFMLVELLREQSDYKLPIKLKSSITMLWRCYGDVITNDEFEIIFKNMIEVGLFIEDNEYIYSLSLNERMEKLEESRNRFSKAGKIGANSRWHRNNVALTSNNTPIALKESKVNKVNKRNTGAFAPPTIELVEDYFEQTLKGTKPQALRFFQFYGAKDWFVGSNKMKNWHLAAARSMNWEEGGQQNGVKTKKSFGQGIAST